MAFRTVELFLPAESWLVKSNFPCTSRMQGLHGCWTGECMRSIVKTAGIGVIWYFHRATPQQNPSRYLSVLGWFWKKLIALFFSFQEVSNVLQYYRGAKFNWMKWYWMIKLRFSFFLNQNIFTRDLPASQAVCIAIMDYMYIEVSVIGSHDQDAPQAQCTDLIMISV